MDENASAAGRAAENVVGDGDPRAAIAAVAEFVARINRHDVGALVERMTDDHLFVDSLGAEMRGREAMRGGWTAYLGWFPDYRIEIHQMLAQADRVLACGVARGTFDSGGAPRAEDAWSAPAAWRAVVRDGRIAEWQVYCDNEPARRVLAARS
ncbi:MAG TPA: nuclear transport factor 2 family protein [Thermoanaerobaculia bacterium]|nr:nuclear transport factor 2 family protein [Thermoanaerobaculia bacterium]